MQLLLDTHVWYRLREDPAKLSNAQRAALRRAQQRNELIGVSAISLWEIAMLGQAGRLRINEPLQDWIEKMADDPLISILPITPAVAADSVKLTGLPGDPADRLIVATARCHGLKLLTADERIREWGGVPVL